MTTRAQDCRKLNALLDAASDSAMATSDADILAEAKLEHADPDARVAQLRKLATDRIVVAKKQRLATARQKIDATNQSPSATSAIRSGSEMRVRISELLTRFVAQETRLTLAFRNGEEMSEADTASLLDDLEALSKLQPKDS